MHPSNLTPFLASSTYINWQHPQVYKKAVTLCEGLTSEHAIVKTCFEFVRDQIKHSWDYQLNPVTCAASDVLTYATGFCYAKSHLLAALLRANHLPTALCYQRLVITDGPPFCLHGLNAVYLKGTGWYRLDARGNKAGINAQCSPPTEQLAFAITHRGEADLPERWAEPLPEVIHALTHYTDVNEVAEHLPDRPL